MQKIEQIKKFIMRDDLEKIILVIALILITGGAMYVYKLAPGRFTDENSHTLQVKRIFRGETNRPVKQLTTIPGYHYTLAFIGKIADPFIDYKTKKGHPSDQWLRVFQVILALLLPIVLFFANKKLKQNQRTILAILSVPTLAPLFFLVYTDVWSLVLVSSAFVFYLYKRYDASALFLLLSLLVRQDNILWLGLLMTLLALDIFVENDKKINKSLLVDFISKSASYFVVMFLFVMFYVFNEGIATGDKSRHPSMSLHFGNIYGFLILFSFMFFPVVISNIKKIYNFYFRDLKRSIITLVLMFTGYFVFVRTLVLEPHVYNVKLRFMHNWVLYYLQENLFFSIFGYSLFVLAIGYFFTKPFIKNKYSLIIPFSFLFLSLHWLFEFRYYIIPLILTFITVRHKTKSLNYQIVYGGVLSLIISYVIFVNKDINVFL
ncbi:MAG: hypothetical protein KAT32_02055 [Candidatus Moranbacteria bacterium]|nr:hypothetical protein [Candidatus Moranbacteria bacterium]